MFRYAAVLLLLSWPASAEVHLDYTFSQWEKLQDDDRTAYIARFIDTLRTMAATEPAQLAARHYSQCIMRTRLTARQLANFLREYVRARPEMQGSSVQHAIKITLVRYAEGPSIECHHIPIEQPTSPFRFSAQVQARHSATTVATRYGRPRSADERQNATADWNSAQRGTFEPQSTLGDPRVNSVQQAIREAAEKGGYRYRSWKVNDLEPNEGYNAL